MLCEVSSSNRCPRGQLALASRLAVFVALCTWAPTVRSRSTTTENVRVRDGRASDRATAPRPDRFRIGIGWHRQSERQIHINEQR